MQFVIPGIRRGDLGVLLSQLPLKLAEFHNRALVLVGRQILVFAYPSTRNRTAHFGLSQAAHQMLANNQVAVMEEYAAEGAHRLLHSLPACPACR